jgi:hypothetical protein
MLETYVKLVEESGIELFSISTRPEVVVARLRAIANNLERADSRDA